MPPDPAMPMRHAAYFLVGPTGVGKTRVAHALALRLGLPILSADSMAVYRGMDVGTAKPTAAERAEVRYAGLDLASPAEPFSAGRYLECVAEELSDLPASSPLIVAGGTGLYVSALLKGLDPLPPGDPVARTRWESVLAERGVQGLQQALRTLAPDRLAALADPANPRRLIRALELAGQPATGPGLRPSAARSVAGLRMEREALHRVLADRSRRMFQSGLSEEVEALERHGGLSPTAAQAIGYAEALAVARGGMPLEAAIERTALRTRQLAKRQMTWFRNQMAVEWIEVTPDADWGRVAENVERTWNQYGPTPLCL